jgi:hypothetical protein
VDLIKAYNSFSVADGFMIVKTSIIRNSHFENREEEWCAKEYDKVFICSSRKYFSQSCGEYYLVINSSNNPYLSARILRKSNLIHLGKRSCVKPVNWQDYIIEMDKRDKTKYRKIEKAILLKM